jgi:hypothetical protein
VYLYEFLASQKLSNFRIKLEYRMFTSDDFSTTTDDTSLVDFDGDGIYETAVQEFDTDGDGQFDSWAVAIDLDNDSYADQVSVLEIKG